MLNHSFCAKCIVHKLVNFTAVISYFSDWAHSADVIFAMCDHFSQLGYLHLNDSVTVMSKVR